MPIILSYSYKTVNKWKKIPHYKPLIKGLEEIDQEGHLKKNMAVSFENYTLQDISKNLIVYVLKNTSQRLEKEILSLN